MPLFGRNRKKILIIDDDQDFQAIYRQKLEKEGYTIMQSLSGVGILELVKRNIPDLILLDIIMPDVDGEKVLYTLKNDPTTEIIPVIILTNVENKAMDCLKLGAVWYLVKANTDISDLLSRIKPLLGG